MTVNALFAYGTLRHPRVIRRVLGRVPDSRPADLPGFARYAVAGEDFPGLVPEPDARTDGTTFLDIQEEEWVKLDRYESDLYVREVVRTVRPDGSPHAAYAYVVPPENRHVLRNASWDLNQYHPTHLSDTD